LSSFFVLIAFLLVVAACAALFLKRESTGGAESYPYISAGPLFTPAERSFLGVLDDAISDEYRIFGKVRLSDLLVPEKGLSPGGRATALNKIQRKHLDFVICRRSDLAVIAVAELDDKSHREAKRGERDDFLEKALAKAGIPLLRFAVKKAYVPAEVRAAIAAVMPAASKDNTLPVDAATPAVNQPPERQAQSERVPPRSGAEAGVLCPACAAQMVKRQARKGEHAGRWFWACSTYPKCRGAVAIEG
jgi:hypothetical protein